MLSAIEPMLAEAVPALPAGPGWLFEPKYDGVRVVAHAREDGVTLLSRRGNRLDTQFPDVAGPVAALRARAGYDFILDGEIVAQLSDSLAGFQMLQSRLGVEDPFRIRMLAVRNPAVLVAFDVLHVGAIPLLAHPQSERRQVLEALLSGPSPGIRLAAQSEDGPALLERSLAEHWEGIVAKRSDSRYFPGQRNAAWLKIKAAKRQEFVVAGYTLSTAGREFAALVLAYHDARGQLTYAGSVGSGFTRRDLAGVHRRLSELDSPACPIPNPPVLGDPVRWTEPSLVAEVRFGAWTADARLRHPVFLGLRNDKDPRSIVREP